MTSGVSEVCPEVPHDLAAAILQVAAAGATVRQQRTVLAESPGDAEHVTGELIARLGGRSKLPNADLLAQRLLRTGGRMLVVGFPGYPARLAQAWPELGAPLWVFVRGGPPPDRPTVAIVGTRKPSLDGMRLARDLARTAVRAGGVVVSGMARGIDQAAHRGALEEGGVTAAVLGSGFAVDYPRGDAAVREAIAESGGLITELLPGTPPRGHQFLERNRVVSALADVTVVVEGKARSGALHTARMAAGQGREVMAVPGSLNAPTSRGPLDLIADGAWPLTRVEDVVAALQLVPPVAAQLDILESPDHSRHLTPVADRLLGLLSGVPASAGTLAAATTETVPAVLAALAELTSRGLAQRSPRGYIRVT